MKVSPLFSLFPVFMVPALAATMVLFASYVVPIIYLQYNLLSSSHAIISKAKSSSGFMFVVCNLIIVLLVGSSRPSSLPGEHLVSKHVNSEDDKGGEDVQYYDPYSEEEEDEEKEVEDVRFGTIDSEDDGYDEDDDDDGEDEEVEEDSEAEEEREEGEVDDGGELTRRIEDFISRINTGWRVERLREMTLI